MQSWHLITYTHSCTMTLHFHDCQLMFPSTKRRFLPLFRCEEKLSRFFLLVRLTNCVRSHRPKNRHLKGSTCRRGRSSLLLNKGADGSTVLRAVLLLIWEDVWCIVHPAVTLLPCDHSQDVQKEMMVFQLIRPHCWCSFLLHWLHETPLNDWYNLVSSELNLI